MNTLIHRSLPLFFAAILSACAPTSLFSGKTDTKMSQPPGAIMTIAYLVDDLDAALKYWTEDIHAGPFFVAERFNIENGLYRGQPNNPNITVALGYSGGLLIALLQTKDEGPSIYQELRARRGSGFHHWAIMREDYDEALAEYAAKGYAPIFTGGASVGGRFAYLDTAEKMDGILELIEAAPAAIELFLRLEAAAKDWDGTDPIRKM